MLIRSLVRVGLTKFFRSDIYIKNKCSGADALLIDMEKNEEGTDDDYKLRSFHRLRDSKLELPKLLVDPISSISNEWIPKLISDPSVSRVALRSSQQTTNEQMNEIDPRVCDHNTVFTMIWDTREERITHSIITYHRINDADIMYNSSIRSAVIGSLEHGIQPLAARTLRFRDMESALQEFGILRQIGFTGAVIRNPNLIEMTNQVFGK